MESPNINLNGGKNFSIMSFSGDFITVKLILGGISIPQVKVGSIHKSFFLTKGLRDFFNGSIMAKQFHKFAMGQIL